MMEGKTNRYQGNEWADEHIDILTEKWSSHSAAEIGVMVNKTRNAVIGKAARLGLARKRDVKLGVPRVQKPPKPEKPEREYKATRISRARLQVAPIPRPEPVDGGLHIMQLEKHHCREVVGRGPADGLARYCGAPKKDGSSFCLWNHSVNYTPVAGSAVV